MERVETHERDHQQRADQRYVPRGCISRAGREFPSQQKLSALSFVTLLQIHVNLLREIFTRIFWTLLEPFLQRTVSMRK